MKANPSIARRLMLRLLLAFALGPVIAVTVLMIAGSGKPNLRVDEQHEQQADAAAALLLKARDQIMPPPQDAGAALSSARFLVYGRDPEHPIAAWPKDLTVSTWELPVGYQTVRHLPTGHVRFLFPPGTADWSDLVWWLRAELLSEDLPLLAVLLLVAVPLALLSVRSSLAPVRQLAREAATIEPGSATARLSERQSPIELLPLVAAINRSLDRIDAGFAAQRRFAARVAHELRTPLAVIAARLDQPPNEEGARALRGDVRGMARLIEQLLTISELSARRLRIDAEVDLVEVAREVVAKAAPQALSNGKHIELAGPERSVTVRGNAAAIATALRNLLENALRYSPAGGLVSARIDADPPAIEVVDEGPGVPPEDQDRLFEPFWRGSRRPGAAGLGLSIVKEMAELHGGSVSVRQNEPSGAVFRIDFPAVVAAATSARRAEPRRVRTRIPV